MCGWTGAGPRASSAVTGELEVLLRSATGTEHTRMVLLSGDAGVGKTRLLTEALDRLTADGWRTLVGHCLDFGETSMPYLPFAEMLAQVGEVAPELVEQDLHPALARLRHRAPADEPSEGLDRAEVFEAMYALRRGPRRPRARRPGHRGRPLGRRQHPRPDQLPALPPPPGPLPDRGDLPLRRDAPPPPAAPARGRVGPTPRRRAGAARPAALPAPCAGWSSR